MGNQIDEAMARMREPCCPQQHATRLLEDRIDGPIFTIATAKFEIRGETEAVQAVMAAWDAAGQPETA